MKTSQSHARAPLSAYKCESEKLDCASRSANRAEIMENSYAVAPASRPIFIFLNWRRTENTGGEQTDHLHLSSENANAIFQVSVSRKSLNELQNAEYSA